MADRVAELARLQVLCSTLRARLGEAVLTKAAGGRGGGASVVLADGALALIDLKEVNRSVWELVSGFKERTQSANAGVDTAELKLQNLQYEKNHFLRQITHLRDFVTDAGPKIELLDEAVFAQQAPPELLRVTKAADAHQFHLNRLELELQQRKALCVTRDSRLAERVAVAERNAEKQVFLDGLQAQLNSLITLSLPLQKLLNQRHTQRWNERRRLHLLPPPLQALYVRAVAYRDTAAPNLELTIVGDIAAAEELLLAKAGAAEGGEGRLLSPRPTKRRRKGGKKGGGGGEGGGGSKGGEKEEDEEDEDEEDALRPHPLRVRVSFKPPRALASSNGAGAEEGEADDGEVCEEGGGAGTELKLQFSCLPGARLLAAEMLNKPRSLLVNLFQDDAGAELPHLSAPPPCSTATETLAALLPSAPFNWAQQLGSELPAGAISGHALPALQRFGQVIDAIAARVEARAALETELARLDVRKTLPPPPAAPALPPAPFVTKLTSWREVVGASDLAGSGAAEVWAGAAAEALAGGAPAWRRASERVFVATLERAQPAENTAVVLEMAVQVFADYPAAAPRVLLRWATPPARVAAAKTRELPAPMASFAAPAALQLAQRGAADAVDSRLHQMEAELNSPLDAVAKEGAPFHLLWTMHRARMLLDVYLETESSGGGASAAVCGTLCNRRVRGRDRRKPFHYSKTTGQFDQAN